MRLKSAILAVSVLALATPAAAQRGGGLRGGSGAGFGAGQGSGAGREMLQACSVDLRAYCSGVQPGGGRIAQCIRQNWDKLGPACQKTILAARSGGQATAPATATSPAASATPATAAAASPPG